MQTVKGDRVSAARGRDRAEGPASDPCAFDGQRCRRDGQERRAAVLAAALRLFSAQGFANTSMREIAVAAKSHLASIYYYFGDKSNLYRSAVSEPLAACLNGEQFDSPGLTLREGLARLFSARVLPFSGNEHARMAWYLQRRERLFPSGAMEGANAEPETRRQVFHFLRRHCSARMDDGMVLLLANSIVAIADEACGAGLAAVTSQAATDELTARLTVLAEGMVAAADAILCIRGNPRA